MNEFKVQLGKGKIQKAYRYIFDIFSDIGKELQSIQERSINTGALFHGYLDMSYLPNETNNQ